MRWMIAIGLIGLLVGVLLWQFPGSLNQEGERFSLLFMTVWLLPMLAGSALLRRDMLPENLKYLVVWVLVALALVLAYSYRDNIMNSRLMAELLPHRARVDGRGAIQVRAGVDGHFHMEIQVNGVPVRFMVDTGASDIMLTPEDAKAVGFDPASLNYTRTYHTASGTVGGAPVRLRSMQVGGVSVREIEASVNQVETNQSLLGMDFLRLFSSYEVKGNTLTLVP